VQEDDGNEGFERGCDASDFVPGCAPSLLLRRCSVACGRRGRAGVRDRENRELQERESGESGSHVSQ